MARKLDVMGVTEVAEYLGRRPSHVSVMVHRGQLPEPDARLAAGPVWRRSTIERWAATRGYTPTTSEETA